MSPALPRGGLLVACLFLALGTAGAATLEGRVTDAASGEALPGATLRVAGLPLGAHTDAEGRYRLWGLPGGTQMLVCTHIGYQTRTDTLALEGGAQHRLDLALQPAAITLGQLEVNATRSEPAPPQAGALTLSAAQLRQAPAGGEPDLVRSLSLLPGVKTASDFGTGLYVRGGSPDQNTVLLDGVRIYNPSHAFGFYSTFNPDAVDRVALYKSAYPATYAGNLGALLEVSTQGETPPRMQGSAGLSLLAARAALGGPWGAGSWKIAGRRTYLDPLLAAARAAGAEVPDYHFFDFNARVDHPLGERGSLAASSYLGSDRLDFALDGDNRLAIEWRNRTLGTTWKRLLSPGLLASIGLAGSEYESRTALEVFTTPIRYLNSVRDLSGSAEVAYSGRDHHSLAAGVQLTGYRLRYSQYFNTAQPDIALDRSPYQAGLYVQDQWRPTAHTELVLGLRASSFSLGRRFDLSPRLALRQTLQPGLTLRAAAGRSVQYLQLVSTEGFSGGDFWLPLDSSAPPSRGEQAALGLDWQPAPGFLLSADLYHHRMHDLVQFDTQVGENSQATTAADLFVTAGEGQASGLELLVRKNNGALQGSVGYTLGRTWRRFADIDEGRAFAPKYDRRHDLSAMLSWQRGAWTLESTFVYATGQAYTPAEARYSLRSPATGERADYVLPAARNSARLLPYHRLDLGARRAFALLGCRAELALQVVNAYSRRNEWFIQYDAGRPATRPKVIRMLPVLPSFGLSLSF